MNEAAAPRLNGAGRQLLSSVFVFGSVLFSVTSGGEERRIVQ